MSFSDLDYNSLLEIAINLDSLSDVLSLISLSPILNNSKLWQDIIQRKFGFRLREATEEDYSFLLKLEKNNGIPSHDLDNAIEKLRNIIKGSLEREERRPRQDTLLWRVNPKHEKAALLPNIVVEAKTLYGALLKYIHLGYTFPFTWFEENIKLDMDTCSKYFAYVQIKEIVVRIEDGDIPNYFPDSSTIEKNTSVSSNMDFQELSLRVRYKSLFDEYNGYLFRSSSK